VHPLILVGWARIQIQNGKNGPQKKIKMKKSCYEALDAFFFWDCMLAYCVAWMSVMEA
jgi:hypothetical protein